MGTLEASGQIVSVEFEIFGQVQGVYFTKYCREMSDKLGLGGWVKNSKSGTIVGKIQGERTKINQMVEWLSKLEVQVVGLNMQSFTTGSTWQDKTSKTSA